MAFGYLEIKFIQLKTLLGERAERDFYALIRNLPAFILPVH